MFVEIGQYAENLNKFRCRIRSINDVKGLDTFETVFDVTVDFVNRALPMKDVLDRLMNFYRATILTDQKNYYRK